MMGTCPHCKISLTNPPYGERETSELLLTLNYRKIVEGNGNLRSFDDLGYCELCNATKKDHFEQNKLAPKIHNT